MVAHLDVGKFPFFPQWHSVRQIPDSVPHSITDQFSGLIRIAPNVVLPNTNDTPAASTNGRSLP